MDMQGTCGVAALCIALTLGWTPGAWAAARGAGGLRFDIARAYCPAFRGDNELGITLPRRDPRAKKDPTMEVLEVRVL